LCLACTRFFTGVVAFVVKDFLALPFLAGKLWVSDERILLARTFTAKPDPCAW
jgi:hypothetical protein